MESNPSSPTSTAQSDGSLATGALATESLATNARAAAISEETIARMVYDFYDDVRADPVLGPVFELQLAGRWETHLPRMVDFWSTVLLAQARFQGNVYGKHMALAGIEKEHFVRWLSLFRKTVTALFEDGPAGEILGVADRVAGSLQLGYFGERTVRLATL